MPASYTISWTSFPILRPLTFKFSLCFIRGEKFSKSLRAPQSKRTFLCKVGCSMRKVIDVRFKISKPGKMGWMKPFDETHICVFASIARRRTVTLDVGRSGGSMTSLACEHTRRLVRTIQLSMNLISQTSGSRP
jgi:hypothetical protein